ncbi:MAG TPA: hypothetical protein VGN01_08065 [Acidobacteriaceae bacterium]
MKAVRIAALLAVSLAVRAQTPPATAHVHDGGSVEMIQNILILPLTGAPFTAIVHAEVTRTLADGTTATSRNRRIVARDSTGRIFQQRAFFVPNGDAQPRIRALEYQDPNTHELYECIVAEKTCYVTPYRRSALASMPAGMGGLQACGCASAHGQGNTVQEEPLGQKTIEDVDVIGSREITTLPAGKFGNEKQEPVVKEFWYSPRIGLNLVTKRFDPRAGSQDFTVDHISLNEPDPKTFEPPADYRVVKQVVVKQAAVSADH